MMRLSTLFCVLFLGFIQPLWANVTIKGQIKNANQQMVYVRYFKEYVAYEFQVADSAFVDQNGVFSLLFDWNKSGIAQLNYGDVALNIYLTPNANITLTADGNKFLSSLKYTGTSENINNYLAQKAAHSAPLQPGVIYRLPEAQFTHTIDSVYHRDKKFFTEWFKKSLQKGTADTNFIQYETAELLYNWAVMKEYYPASFAYYNRQAEQPVMSKEYYNFLSEAKVHNPQALQSPVYFYVYKQAQNAVKNNPQVNEFEAALTTIEQEFSGDLREYLIASKIKDVLVQFNDLLSGEYLLNQFKQFAQNKAYITLLDNIVASMQPPGAGKPAPDFTAKDMDGKDVKLSDFKGKVVYVDVWATWCGPCLREMPHSEKLQEEFKGKDVVFLNVSVDEHAAVWSAMVKQRDIKGYNVHAGKGAPVSQIYGISSIPRYILVDKDGNLVDGNATRPSNPQIKLQLEKLLQ
jgi:thiol-disulfide isomerase/thioredoxin